MDYWRGAMDWPVVAGWECQTCGKSAMWLEWGFIHTICRCAQCHTQYRMRDVDDGVVDVPICQLKEKYKVPMQVAWNNWHKPTDELTDNQWEEVTAD